MVAALRKSGWRAGLAMACVALGIASIMLTMALSTGAQRAMEAVADKVGRNILVIAAGTTRAKTGAGQGWFPATTLKPEDADALADLPGVRAAAPVREGSLKVKYGRHDMQTTIRGVTPDFLGMRNFQVADGRMFDDGDRTIRARVAVAGALAAQKLNEGRSLVGERIWIGGTPFEVVGQLKDKGMSGDGTNEDDQILVPLETAMQRLFHVDYLSDVLVQASSAAAMAPAGERARALLRANHALDPDVKDDFELLSLVKTNAVRNMSNQFLEGMSRLFAAITLSIGAAGVLSVSLMNVKDRTGEIGLRMAIGARRRDIATLFVAEACLLSVAGGVAGVATGLAGITVLKGATGWQMEAAWAEVAVPFALSAGMGLVFGVLPALKASRLAPVVALRAA
ncbi:MAG: ABC transporter permease [Telluria sp.]